MAISRSRNDESIEKIRIIVKMDDFNRQDQSSTIQRYLIVLYLASKHTLFKDAGDKHNDNFRFFSGPKLISVARRISKEWQMGDNPIKFDRSRIVTKYKKCENEGYVKIKPVTGAERNKVFALTKKGSKHCEDIINKSYRKASSRNLSKVRVIAINSYLKNTYFLALKEDGSYVLGTADNDLKNKGIAENSLIEYIKKEQDTNLGLFQCRIEHMVSDSLRIMEDDGSIPTTTDMIRTDIKKMDIEDKLYYVRGKIIRRWSPDDVEGVKEIEDVDSGVVTIQDSTGEIDYVKLPYDTGWREERIRVGTWVEALGIFKSGLRIRDFIKPTSLYAPYKVEFFRPLNH